MPVAVSIHIGVDRPNDHLVPLQHSEGTAWGMAGLASRAECDRILVLRGAAATRAAVHDALAGAAGALAGGDTLLVTFSGHGGQEPDRNDDERHGSDESWCLHDGVLLDDHLAGYWRLFAAGVRIVVVSESCYSGGMARTSGSWVPDAGTGAAPRMRGAAAGGLLRYRGGTDGDAGGAWAVQPSYDSCAIQASVLMLTASAEGQPAQEGLFTRSLLHVWADGAFEGSYCELYRQVRERVMAQHAAQEPQLLLLGAAGAAFAEGPAFRLKSPPTVYRGRGGGAVPTPGSAPA
jgi:metacaspase-1